LLGEGEVLLVNQGCSESIFMWWYSFCSICSHDPSPSFNIVTLFDCGNQTMSAKTRFRHEMLRQKY
jgi:hypothetical protein